MRRRIMARFSHPAVSGPGAGRRLRALREYWVHGVRESDSSCARSSRRGSEATSTVEWAHPEIECVIADGLDPGTWRGLAGMAAGYRRFLDAWEGIRTEVEECRELDAEHVLMLHHTSGAGRRVDWRLAQTSTKSATVFHIRAGKVTRLVIYWDRQHALAELGLPLEPVSPHG